MSIYIYESHMGGIYFSEHEYNDDELYCKQCGDSDWFIGTENTIEEALSCLANMIDIDDSGGYNLEDILEQMRCFEKNISLEEAIEIVRKNKDCFDDEEE